MGGSNFTESAKGFLNPSLYLACGLGAEMSHVSFNRKRVKLKQLLGIRARLALLALILVAPLMLDRARSLEDTRSRQIALASQEFADLAQHSADTQREVISSVETMLKSAAYIRASGGVGRSCDILRASLPLNLPWILSIMIVSKNGLVQCSTLNNLVGLDLSDREYLKKAREAGGFVFSDFLFAKSNQRPIMMAAYPVSAINREEDSIVVAGMNLDWMSKIMSNLGRRPGISAVLVDSAGVVLAAPADQASMIGRPLDTMPLLSVVAEKVIGSDQPDGSLSFADGEGSKRIVHFVRIPGTQSRLVVSIDESGVTAAINREIHTAYLQLLFFCLFVLLGALVAAERLIIRPIEMMVAMAKRFGQGDRSVRAARNRLPAEFVPLARALNAMAAQLIERERELVATNERLTVIASIDMLSGLANRRGFQSRLDFEWMKETLAGIAAETMGFAGRYGGEEFCLLVPNIESKRALQIGEMVRAAVQNLAMPHCTSHYQTVTVSVGVACTKPNEERQPSDLIEAADAALYAAKHRGRNAVVEHGVVRLTDGGIALAS